MKISKLDKFLIAPIILSLANTALAQDIDCNTIKVNMSSIAYEIKAVFPNSKKTSYYYPMRDNVSAVDFSSCGFTITSDKDKASFKVKDNKTLHNLFFGRSVEYQSDINLPFVSRYGSTFSSITLHYWLEGGQFGLSGFTSINKEYYGSDYTFNKFKDIVIGYRINNGELMPALYEGKVSAIPKITSNDTIDFYFSKDIFSSSYRIMPTRYTFDLKNSTLTLWKDFAFPEK